jgi:hypothetical protein
MPPGDAPILTGDHPPLGNADINARVRTIVKWQSLYSGSDDGDKPRIRAVLVERCPRSSGLSNGKGNESWVLVGSGPADRAANEYSQVRGTITALKYGEATPKVAQACVFFSRSSRMS